MMQDICPGVHIESDERVSGIENIGMINLEYDCD
jgi:hypothetical protein